MSKITTEVCKDELNKRWPIDGEKSRKDWKRLSKSGNASTSIVRIFQHTKLPVFAKVVEENGAITQVLFAESVNALKQHGSEKSGATTTDTKGDADSTASGATGTPGKPASNGRVSADEFLFAVCERDNRRTTFAICRVDFWHQNHYLSDEGFGDLLDGLLPKGTSVASECQYSNKMGRKQLYEFLLAQGFMDDERFTAYMDGYQPGE